MKYTDFEKHINSELSGAQEPVQIDSLLAALDLDNGQKKRFPLWIIVPFLLMISSAVYIGLSDFSSSDTSTKTYSSTEQNATNKNTTTPIVATIDSKNPTNTSISTNLTNTITTDDSNSTTSNLIPSDKLNKTKTETPIDIPQNQGMIETEKVTVPKSNTHVHSQGSLTESESQETNQRNSTDSYLPPEGVENQNINLGYSPINNSKKYIKDQRINLDVSSLVSARTMLEIASIEEDKDDIFSRMKINCPSFSNAQWRMALIPEVGLHQAFKTIESKTVEIPDALSTRKLSETSKEAINLGLYGMLLRDKLPVFIKAGISYTRITERMELDYNYTELDTTIGIISSTVSGNGDTITHIYGPVVSEIQHIGSNRRHHYIHLFDMPVSIGYSTYFAGMDIAIEGGVKINLLTEATGNILVSKKDYTNLSFESLFKKRIGVSYFGGLMLGRNFGQLGDFYIAPRFSYYPDDFTNANTDISQKYFTVGINAGFIYKI